MPSFNQKDKNSWTSTLNFSLSLSPVNDQRLNVPNSPLILVTKPFLFPFAFFFWWSLTMQNEAPTGVAYTSQNQSVVAAFVAADKVAFYPCAFYSTQNTLFDYKGRHYYDNCFIQGSIDFIFGRGRSIFHVRNLIKFSVFYLFSLFKFLWVCTQMHHIISTFGIDILITGRITHAEL